jgi:CubicO group peptidase (beta-lactamase class C family)
VPGAVVAVADASATMFVKGYGVRQARSPSPVDENTRFQIASLTKFVAATAIATLVDQGVVSWDVPVRQFPPDTVLAEPYVTQNASLRDYLAHRTGLPAYAGDLLAQLGYSPGRNIGIAVFASKQLMVFPEAVRAEFLERVLGHSGRDLQMQIRDEQDAWNTLVAISKPPATPSHYGAL